MWHACLFKGFSAGGFYGRLRNPLRCPTKKWDTCGAEETHSLFYLLSNMETTQENMSNAPGSRLIDAKKAELTCGQIV